MSDFHLTKSNLGGLVQMLTELLTSGNDYRVSIKQWRESRSLSMNSFQHVIYSKVSKYLISKGRLDWSEEVTKDNLKNKFLGWIDKEYTDIITGEITVKSVLRQTSKLDSGEAYHYTTQLIEWAEFIGCRIEISATGEYKQLMDKQND